MVPSAASIECPSVIRGGGSCVVGGRTSILDPWATSHPESCCDTDKKPFIVLRSFCTLGYPLYGCPRPVVYDDYEGVFVTSVWGTVIVGEKLDTTGESVHGRLRG